MTNNIYSELCHERQEIRLVFLNAGQRKDEITAILMVTSLRWAPEFEALSYVWGDPLITRPIQLNGQPFQVTENLEAALRRLRHIDRVRIMWIDAICINQRDSREQEHQIGLMRDIFGRCARCVIWLGEEDDETERALEALRWMKDDMHVHEWPCFDESKVTDDIEQNNTLGFGTVLAPLRRFLLRSWFHRTWTFQEFVLPREHEIRCGHFDVPFDLLRESPGNFRRHIRSCCSSFPKSLIPLLTLTSNVERHLDRTIYPIVRATSCFQNHQPLDFLDLLDENCHKLAAIGHDKVYGLIGLASSCFREAITPDYKLNIAIVYSQPIVTYWQTIPSLRPLVLVGKQNPRLRLPSWVPDWSMVETDAPSQQFRAERYHLFKACGHQSSPPVVYDHRTLHVRGINWDTVSRLGPAISERLWNVAVGKGCFDTVRSWYELAISYGLPSSSGIRHTRHSQHRAFWRTMLFDIVPSYIANIDGNARPVRATENDYDTLRTEFELFEAQLETFQSPVLLSNIMQAMMKNVLRKQFIITDSGYLGMVPLDTRVGDQIFFLANGNMPFVLRPSQKTFSPPGLPEAKQVCYKLVGECYLDGLMDGELAAKLRDEAVDVFII
ncbi:HET domain containing protein [Hyaloscypha variabilis]